MQPQRTLRSKHFYLLTTLLCATACEKGPGETAVEMGPSLTERLESGEVRAGVVTDESALFGGVSAEGKIGDIKIYNDRARFVIQSAGESNYYVGYGGSVVDADIIRPFGQPGQDLIDDSSTMIGLGRMFDADTVEVIHNGADGEAAVVRATGGVSPLTLLTGTLESNALILDRNVEITTDYILEPDSWLLRMETHVLWLDNTTPIQLADIAFVAVDIADIYQPSVGYDDESAQEVYGWTSVVGQRNEVALALLQGEEQGEYVSTVLLDTIRSLGPLLLGPRAQVDLADGDEMTWSRYMGVAPDVASMTDEWLLRRGDTVATMGGSVTHDGEAIAGARVHLLDEAEKVLTMAITDEHGAYRARVPEGTAARVVAESRGSGIYYDRKEGAGWYSPYGANIPRGRVLSSIESGATPVAFSPGYGVSEPQDAAENVALTLTAPGMLTVQLTDGEPAVVRVSFEAGDPVSVDRAVAPQRPSGEHAWLYVRDGEGTVPLEPGQYRVVVHRGTTHEAHEEVIEVTSGEEISITAELEQSVDTTGLWSLDPHSHAAPSGDGAISMSGRLIVTAAHGVDVHFGTDHDHVADYRVLLEPLKLHQTLASIVADEVSPSLRGHHNAYPLEVAPEEVNGGAVMWWETWSDFVSTTGMYAEIRAMVSDGDVLIQANHPTSSSGLFDNASWNLADGEVTNANKWDDSFDAFEVLNDGGYATVVPYYLDMLNRGMSPTPVGVSDSHTHRGGVGENRTWAPIDIEDIRELTNDHIRTAIREGGTVASHGPLVVATIDGQWAPGSTHTGSVTLDVDIRTPSWMVVDTLHVYENGEEIMTLDVDEAPLSLSLSPEDDAVYVLIADGSQDMSPVYPGQIPWALTQGFFIDVDGDGWDSPLPSLTVR
jgi:hypothetical protein